VVQQDQPASAITTTGRVFSRTRPTHYFLKATSMAKNLPKPFAKWYGIRDCNGDTNGQVNWRFIFSDVAKALIIALLIGMGKVGMGMYSDAKTARVKVDALEIIVVKHCERQVDTEERILQSLGRIEGRIGRERNIH
jgi:hypothetical protein